ncbi:hypothetical protein GmHk_10G027507 [Glycine max]|nr:hypothetical protein GmHk_10G027507 [Glycine max]
MSTEKGNADISDNSVQPPSSENNLEKWHFGRALAYRAVYGSNHRKSRGLLRISLSICSLSTLVCILLMGLGLSAFV